MRRLWPLVFFVTSLGFACSIDNVADECRDNDDCSSHLCSVDRVSYCDTLQSPPECECEVVECSVDADCLPNRCGPDEAPVCSPTSFSCTCEITGPGTETFFDDFEEMASSRWESTPVGSSAGMNGIDGVDSFLPDDGNPGGYLEMSHKVDGTGLIRFQHVYQNGTYDPVTQGAISSIDYREDQISPTGQDVSSRLLLIQGGEAHIAVLPVFNRNAWSTAPANGLVASDFDPEPDFSGTGPIEFGFERANSNTSAGVTLDVDHGIDNWSVTVHHLAPAP